MAVQKVSQFPVLAALDDTDRIVVLDVTGPSNASITVVDSKFRDDVLLLPAEQMLTTSGTPSTADSLDVAVYWALDAATTETVAGKVLIPDHWSTFNILARFLNTTASGGNVRVRADLGTLANGAIPSVSTGTVATVA